MPKKITPPKVFPHTDENKEKDDDPYTADCPGKGIGCCEDKKNKEYYSQPFHQPTSNSQVVVGVVLALLVVGGIALYWNQRVLNANLVKYTTVEVPISATSTKPVTITIVAQDYLQFQNALLCLLNASSCPDRQKQSIFFRLNSLEQRVDSATGTK